MGSLVNEGQVSRIQKDSIRRSSSDRLKKPVEYGRVVRVIMNSDDPDWENLGYDEALYGIFYQKLFSGHERQANVANNFAYCRQNSFKRIPVENEIVSLSTEIDADASYEAKFPIEKVYWDTVIPVWNSVHLNLFPDTDEVPSLEYMTDLQGEYFKEKGTVYHLQLCPGDITMEGRHGQSIRMGGTDCEEDYSPIAEEWNNGSPYMILRNGQADPSLLKKKYIFKDAKGTIYSVNEDINHDKSSIYLTSNHQVPLTQSCEKRLAWKDAKGPTLAKDYVGAEIVANSDRIYLNARKDDIELSAKDVIGINAENAVCIDAGSKGGYVAFDAQKILLGEAAVLRMNKSNIWEPVLKGRTTTEWLSDLCTQLNNLLSALSKPADGDSKVWITAVIGIAEGTMASIKTLQSTLPSLHSKKVYTE